MGVQAGPRPERASTVVRFPALIYLYRRRLRAHAVQELLAGLGVAVAVALIFAVLVANANIASSTNDVVRTVVGPANLQLRARGSEGFDERTLARVEHLPGVKQAAPLLEQPATIVGAHERRITLDLAGADASLTILNGLAHTLPIAVLSQHGIGLSDASATSLDITRRDVRSTTQTVSVRLRGRSFVLPVTSVLGPEAVGALSRAVVAVMPLAQLQQLAGLPGRISRILVQTERGREHAVRDELEHLAAGRLTVAPADQDVALLRQAIRPSNLASGLFAAIAGLLGVLLAFNAMLLTIPDRRQAIADLRLAGARRGAIAQMVLFQALCLGLAASLVGVLAGYALSRNVLQPSTGYLSQAFALGNHTAIGFSSVLIAFAGGILAILLASGVLLLDLRRGRELDAVYLHDGVPGNALEAPTQLRLALGGLALLVVATVAFALAPQLALGASAVLALATVFAVPLLLALTLRGASALARRVSRLTILLVAVTALKATTLRSLALAAMGALALFGAIALGGARENLLEGLRGFADNYTSAADIWVLGQGDLLAVDSFAPDGYAARIARIPGVASVEPLQSEYLNVGERRIWLTARGSADTRHLLEEQVVEGSAPVAARRLGEGGWVTVSQQLAAERHLKVGDVLLLPTPTGETPFRLAALTTNFGWSPGALLMASQDHERDWASSTPTALGIRLSSGASSARVRRTIATTLGPNNGLEVIGAGERAGRFVSTAREGLGQLQEISLLLTLAAILAMAAALGSAIWQRRPSLAAMRISGAAPYRLRQILLSEAMLMLGAGCLTGVLGGLYGQAVIDSYLKHVTGYPVVSITASWRPLAILSIVAGAVLALVAVPLISASRVTPELALQE
jgi:putative ABC transport system permease protein